MRRLHVTVFTMAIAGLLGSSAMAADADHGADLARRWCAACHLVEGAQKQASADVPSFAAIARRSDFTPEKVAYFLLDPHPKTPECSCPERKRAIFGRYLQR